MTTYPAGLLVLCGALACATPGTHASTAGLPSFELPDLDGNSVRLSDYLGKDVVFLDFWASWCQPCHAEMPHLQTLYDKYRDRGFIVLGIAMDDTTTTSQVAPSARKDGIRFPVLLDTQSRAVTLYNPGKSAPYGVLIDRKGRVVHQRAGYTPGDEGPLEVEIQKNL
jgi:peroxiredoxin